MRVLALFSWYLPRHNAGAEWMAHSMLRGLVARGHRCDVALSVPGRLGTVAQIDIDGVHVHRRRANVPALVAAADVIVTQIESTPAAARVARRNGKPLVQLLHNDFDISRAYLELGASLAVFNSEWMAESFGYSGPHLVVRPPVFADDYRTTPGEAITLVNLYPPKGSPTFWALAERMGDRAFIGVRGGYGPQLERRLPNVELFDHTPEIRTAYGRTRILLMPSEYESWGRVGVEAMASGIPVIAHPTPGLRESLGPAGIFVDRGDIDGWERAIRKLDSPRAYRAASKRALKRSAELDPSEDLARWAHTIEAIGGHTVQETTETIVTTSPAPAPRARGRRIASERLYQSFPDGRRVLVAAKGQPIPDGFEVDGVVEASNNEPPVETTARTAPRSNAARRKRS